MNIQQWLPLAVPVAFLLMWAVETKRPARAYPSVPRWHWWGAGFFVLTATVGSLIPFALPVGTWALAPLWNVASLGWWGWPMGMLLTSLLHYAWHRAEHRFNALWRLGHQLHHSPPRVDIPGAFYAHPAEVTVKTLISVVVTSLVLGLQAPVAASVTTCLALLSLFQHWNIHTPQWLGWLIPRPEMHALHHERDVHARNYADLPIWDMLFGSYENPVQFNGQVGFEPTRAHRVGDMLLMRDLHQPSTE